ncbi:MAG: hypothetical protein ABEI77_02365 [Halorientalis sp.]
MGIKCSLLGHSFSGSKVEEEREEQGSEVLTTIKEIETCERCGTERVVSENKEVTSLEAPTEDGDDEPGDADEAGTEEPASDPTPSPTPDIDAAEDDAELIGEAEPDDESDTDESTSDSAPDGTTESEPVTATDQPESTVEAAEDDGVILEDDDDEPDREPGEWPDADEPDIEIDDAGPTAEATDEAAAGEGRNAADTGSEPVTEEWPDEYGHDEKRKTAPEVEWPEEDQPAASDWEPSESLTKQIDSAEIEPAGGAAITVPDGEFECPECGFRTSVEKSSLRAGDFCPECHRGSLEHRADDETRKE